ncbi:hypothetical protein [uncultured Algibacter sp.]|uniref:hypothetical protein n=1 Tax=uncultured Algibacter sp. TaxID=298659 RepID=UPI0026028AF4|nr:hypothetical protein [uncultured Algibacter sp.]
MLSIMTTENKIPRLQNSNYLKLESTKKITNRSLFNKYLNWVSGEFELYLQEHSNGLKVYFPGGLLIIQSIESNSNEVKFKIVVSSKNKQNALSIKNTAETILSHLILLEQLK